MEIEVNDGLPGVPTLRSGEPALLRSPIRAGLVVEYAAEADAGPMLAILSQTFSRDILLRTPLGCDGAHRYVRDSIRQRGQGSDTIWVVARDPEVVGFVEMRLTAEELFLNHIHVSPCHQGQGIGGRLLRRAIEWTRPPGTRHIGLSVFEDRQQQIDWYTRLSFAPVGRSEWMTCRLEESSALDWFSLSELPQAECVHARYGFSAFGLKTRGGAYRIGRLGDRFFTTQESAIVRDPAALAALRQLDPERALVLTTAEPDLRRASGLNVTHALAAHRMRADIDAVLARLPEGWR